MFSREHILSAFSAAVPIMLGYVAIGLPCGILGNTIGLNPLQVALLSILLYSGAGQFMIPNMFLAGSSVAAITASVSLVNTRQMLYAASFAPQCAASPRWLAALFAASVTDECKALGLTGPAILIGAVAGVVCALAFSALFPRRPVTASAPGTDPVGGDLGRPSSSGDSSPDEGGERR